MSVGSSHLPSTLNATISMVMILEATLIGVIKLSLDLMANHKILAAT